MRTTIAIIGGGVIGLNIALEISSRNLGEVFLLEKELFLGHHTSTRNSEVIHAGLAYPKNSLKNRFCLDGNGLTYELLNKLGVPHRRCGKWIVAYTAEESLAILRMLEHARDVGTPGLRPAAPDEVCNLSSILARPLSAAFSETTGIMDSSAYLAALCKAIFNINGIFPVYPCEVTAIDLRQGRLDTKERGDMDFDVLINAAGLFADEIYKMCSGSSRFEIRPFKGEYYSWNQDGFDGLVYPVPRVFMPTADPLETSHFGIHLHRSIGGTLYLGPSQVETPQKDDYKIKTPPFFFVKAAGPLLKIKPAAEAMSMSFSLPKAMISSKKLAGAVTPVGLFG